MAQRKVNLDSHEEELAAREQAIGGALKEAKDAAAAAEAAKKELETKVAQLEADLKASGEELAALKRECEKDAAAHGELQGRLAERSKELSAAKDSNADLELKLTTLTKTLDDAREQDMEIATKVSVELQRTGADLKSRDRVVKRSEKDSLYAAMDVSAIWLERALAGK